MAQRVMIHTRILAGEAVEVRPSPDPLEAYPYEVGLRGDREAVLAKAPSEAEADLIKAAFTCMFQVLGADAPSIIKSDIKAKIEGSKNASETNNGEVQAPSRQAELPAG